MDSDQRAVLRDGSEVLIRPIRGTDAPALAAGFARLSARTRHLRFLSGKRELSAKELRYLTEVDHHDHEALAAVDPAAGRGLGVARYVRSADDARSADIALTVVDEWQGRGVGTALAEALIQRRPAEVTRLRADVEAENLASLALLTHAGRMSSGLPRRGIVDVTVDLPAA